MHKCAWLRSGCALMPVPGHATAFVLHGGRSSVAGVCRPDRPTDPLDDWYLVTLSLNPASRQSGQHGGVSGPTLTAASLAFHCGVNPSPTAAYKHTLVPLSHTQQRVTAFAAAVLGGEAGPEKQSPLAFVHIDVSAATVHLAPSSAPLPAELRSREAYDIIAAPSAVQCGSVACAALVSVPNSASRKAPCTAGLWLAVEGAQGLMVCRAGTLPLSAHVHAASARVATLPSAEPGAAASIGVLSTSGTVNWPNTPQLWRAELRLPEAVHAAIASTAHDRAAGSGCAPKRNAPVLAGRPSKTARLSDKSAAVSMLPLVERPGLGAACPRPQRCVCGLLTPAAACMLRISRMCADPHVCLSLRCTAVNRKCCRSTR